MPADAPLVRALADSTALVTGGTSGVGLEAARQLAGAGVKKLAISGRSAERGQAALAELKSELPETDIRFVKADVVDPASVAGMVEATIETFGRIDILLNSAGINHSPQLFHETELDGLGKVVADSMLGPLHTCRAVLPHMMAQNGGSIIIVASDAAKVPTPGESVIGAAMAGLAMFTRTLAMEAKRNGVRVNCLTPSLVSGTLTYDRVMAPPFSRKLFEKAARAAHLGIAEPGDQAAMIVFLASPEARRMTGQVISVNGGISAG